MTDGCFEVWQVEDEYQGELCRDQDVTLEAEAVKIDVGAAEGEINDAEDSINDTDGDFSEEHQTILKRLKEIMMERRTGDDMFKKVGKKVLKVQTDRVNEAKVFEKQEHCRNRQFDCNCKCMGDKTNRIEESRAQEKNEPRWKHRIQGDIKRLRQEVNFLERESKGELGSQKKHKLNELSERYKVKRKELKAVIQELKQMILAKSAKVRRYEQIFEQFRGNRFFDFDQMKMYAEFNGVGVRPNDVPMLKKVNDFGVTFEASEKDITNKKNA